MKHRTDNGSGHGQTEEQAKDDRAQCLRLLSESILIDSNVLLMRTNTQESGQQQECQKDAYLTIHGIPYVMDSPKNTPFSIVSKPVCEAFRRVIMMKRPINIIAMETEVRGDGDVSA
jgi:hypothetical protein